MSENTTGTETVETVEKVRIIKAGGAKGAAIVALMTEHPELTRQQLAEQAGATVGRVGETVRWMRDHGSKEEKAIVAKHLKSAESRKALAKKEADKKAAERKAEQERKAKERAAEKAAKATAVEGKASTKSGSKSETGSPEPAKTRKPRGAAAKAAVPSEPSTTDEA